MKMFLAIVKSFRDDGKYSGNFVVVAENEDEATTKVQNHYFYKKLNIEIKISIHEMGEIVNYRDGIFNHHFTDRKNANIEYLV